MTSRDLPSTPDTSSPKYNPNAKCDYHSSSPGHETDQCWALKNKIQDLIDNKTIEFDPPPTPNVITTPMPKDDKGVNEVNSVGDSDEEAAFEDWVYLTTMELQNWHAKDFMPISFLEE